MPFWLGEAPARSEEMSAAVSRCVRPWTSSCPGRRPRKGVRARPAMEFLKNEYLLGDRGGADRRVPRRSEAQPRRRADADVIALERFFDESGGMQLVLHAPFGSRINRAWGLALRKKFCQGSTSSCRRPRPRRA